MSGDLSPSGNGRPGDSKRSMYMYMNDVNHVDNSHQPR